MKQYLLFAYHDYYPSGGFNDFVQDFEYYDEIVPYIRKSYDSHSIDNFHIVDIETGSVERFDAEDIWGGKI